MFKVIYSDANGNSSKFAELKTDVEAVQLSLALHQSSNVPHCVCAMNAEDREFLSLVLSK